MRIVCDFNVLVRTAINPTGLAKELLSEIRTAHTLVVSLPLLAELLEVLRQPKITSTPWFRRTRNSPLRLCPT